MNKKNICWTCLCGVIWYWN